MERSDTHQFRLLIDRFRKGLNLMLRATHLPDINRHRALLAKTVDYAFG